MDRLKPDRLLATVGTASLGLAALALVLAILDARTLGGVSVWLKPGKFGLSIGLYLWTMALILPLLPGPRSRVVVRWLATISMLVELAAIYFQAARGVPSHFNIGDPFDALIFSAMGLGIAVNIAANTIAAVASFRAAPAVPPPLLWGVRLGLLVLLFGTLEGGVMIAHQSHTIGALDGGPGLPLVNWSTVAGDLRVAHFIGMHGFQALPLLGWLLRDVPPTRGVPPVVALALGFAGVVAFTLLGALSGRPLL